jgi:hypothetical protein
VKTAPHEFFDELRMQRQRLLALRLGQEDVDGVFTRRHRDEDLVPHAKRLVFEVRRFRRFGQRQRVCEPSSIS